MILVISTQKKYILQHQHTGFCVMSSDAQLSICKVYFVGLITAQQFVCRSGLTMGLKHDVTSVRGLSEKQEDSVKEKLKPLIISCSGKGKNKRQTWNSNVKRGHGWIQILFHFCRRCHKS
jgi:hypothetical protein